MSGALSRRRDRTNRPLRVDHYSAAVNNEPVKNRDLWERLLALRTERVGFAWVRGHDGDAGNERTDFIARRRLLTALEGDRAKFRAAVQGFSRHRDFDPRPYLEENP